MKYWREVNGKHRILKCSRVKIRELMKNEAAKYPTAIAYYKDKSALHWVEIKASEIVGYDVVEI